ncbi:MAG: ATP-binding protein [Planctomycetota bacterium]
MSGDEPVEHGDASAVTLADCADEPIHRPGMIQPHGAMLVFDAVPKLVAHSANARQVLGDLTLPEVGAQLGPEHMQGRLLPLLQDMTARSLASVSLELDGPDGPLDLVAHQSDGVILVEAETRPDRAGSEPQFAYLVHQVTSRLQQETDLVSLLGEAVVAVRDLTGFDRVMAYQFLEDDSGEVVAEARRSDLEPFLGLRYPSTDIPSQARRLYVLNRVRTIPDVDYEPVPLVPSSRNPVSGRDLDMSHCVLRSVSPIHVEYLNNMGVGASMSVSLVVGGRLWGLIACHHMGPKYPSLNVRLSCLILSEHLSLLVAKVSESRRLAVMQKSAQAARLMVERAAAADDVIQGVISGTPTLLDVVPSDGAAIVLGGRIATIGRVPPRQQIRRLVDRVATRAEPVFASHRAEEWVQDEDDSTWAGLLAAEFFRDSTGYLLWFRSEQVRQVRWAGNPEKVYAAGPNGGRLSPRGSFEEWKELARGTSASWLDGEIDAAQEFRVQLQRVALQRVSRLERMQSLLIGVLGHDLRTPLHAISLSAEVLAASHEAGDTIRRSTSRMQSMIDRMLDYARLANNEGLTVQPRRQDVHVAIRAIVDEACAAFPGCEIDYRALGDPLADFDGTRMGQLVSNLLSNARHHGDASRPIQVVVDGDDRVVQVAVSNYGEPIAEDRRESIFDAFVSDGAHKDGAHQGGGGKGGGERVGLGLFICRAIVRAHGGTISVACDDGQTTFAFRIPRSAAGGDAH